MTERENTEACTTTAIPRHTWQRRKHARPAEIASAALASFAENGYAATTMADVASRAGITKGTIYLYYPNKEELFNALVREHIAEKLAAKIVLLSEANHDILAAIKGSFDIITDMILTEEAFVLGRIITTESGRFPGMVQFWRQEVVDRLLIRFSTLMQHGSEEGVINIIEPKAAALLCLAPTLQSLVWRSTFRLDDNDFHNAREVLVRQHSLIIRGLVNGAMKS